MQLRLVLPLAVCWLAGALTLGCEKNEPPPKAPEPVPHYNAGPPPPPVVDPVAIKYPHPGRSYDDALSIPEDLDAVQSAPELSDAELSAPMTNPAFLAACGVSSSTVLMVKVAVRAGKALGVTVATSPPSAELASCVDKAVRQLAWPPSAKRFTFTTRF